MGLPVLRASYTGEIAIGDEDLYGGAFSVLASLQVAEAWLGTPFPYAAVVRAYRLPGVSQSRWTSVLAGLTKGAATGLRWTYEPTPAQAHPTLAGMARTSADQPSLVVASGDTLYEVTGADPSAPVRLGASLP